MLLVDSCDVACTKTEKHKEKKTNRSHENGNDGQTNAKHQIFAGMAEKRLHAYSNVTHIGANDGIVLLECGRPTKRMEKDIAYK